MSIMNTSQLSLIEKFLDLATARQSLLVSNIANVDTPGYRTQDMDFHGEMVRALSQDPGSPVIPMVRDVPGLLSRPDGNNVSVDREGLLLAELQLKYQAATQAMRSEFALIRSVVSDAV
ncbi:MAG TPA: flagellar basal body protein [Verrucomicrobiae bacterium]|nr:flagellar basal body protein [Verrucomicrobiae bacterium]